MLLLHTGVNASSLCLFLQAVRSTHGLEVPLSQGGKLLVEPEYIRFLTQVANQKMEENLRRIQRSVMACFLFSYCHSAAGRSELYSCASLSSLGSMRISSQPCLKRNSRNYRSRIHPSHRNYKIPLTDSRTKTGKWQRTKRRERKWVCISGGGNGKNTLRRTVARVTLPVAFQNWTTIWTCSRDVAASGTFSTD